MANFPVTDAIDALTLGSVNFLPKRIAEVTTNLAPATDTECQEMLPRLQQILTTRVSTAELPIEFTNVVISAWMKREICLIIDEYFFYRKWNSEIDS